MKKQILTVVAAVTLIAMPIYAKNATKEYQRPSLHMVLMTSQAGSGGAQVADPEILGYAAESWTNYEFPALYNNFAVPFARTDVGAAKGSIMDVLAMYSSPESLNGMGINELKNVIEMLQGKQYREALKVEVDKVADEVAHQLVKKWWSIGEDGSISDTLLFRLACYSATQNQANNAAQDVIGAQKQLFNELADATMANTYITFTKLDFYENEPIAAFVKNIMQMIASATPAPANMAAQLAVDKTYDAMKEGYTAFTNNLLYKLEWNEEIANNFYNLWTDKNHIDIEKFNATPFHLVYVGNTSASATCMMKKEDKGQGAAHMVYKTCHKAIGRQFAKMQRAYEEFRPMVPVIGIDAKGGVIADMGTKEGIKVGDQFQLLEPITNEKGVTKYNYKAVVKVVKWADGDAFKDGVWDNEEIDNAQEADKNESSVDVIGTHLSKFKGATPSMFVKMAK